jgi:pyruvate/2-oxoglutarate dehydrogenase complex dihydrolipoamide dehydrogenase (E3) component
LTRARCCDRLERVLRTSAVERFERVDDELRTNVAGIWSLGDCNGKGAFTHTAYNDYEIVAANLGSTSVAV